MLKKPNVLLASYSNLHTICCPNSGLPTPSFPSPVLQNPKCLRHQKQQRRSYASVQPDKPTSDRLDDLSWPSGCPSRGLSPYQILRLSPREAYSKHRFYALVKIYHPDRSNHTQCHAHIHSLPGVVKMERYRLIVAANEILSNPDKRKAYDHNGAGWDGRMEHGVRPSRYNWSQTASEARWSGFDTNDSPFQNATWEDWERWYKRHEKQEPVYNSNGGFLTVVVVALVLGAFGQTAQMSRHGSFFKEQAGVQNEKARNMVTKHQQESQKALDKEERLQRFLRERDFGASVGLGDMRAGDRDRNLLQEPVLCMSDMQQKLIGKRGRRDENG